MNVTVNAKNLVITGLVVSVLALLAMKEEDGPKDFILMKTVESPTEYELFKKIYIAKSDGTSEVVELEVLKGRDKVELANKNNLIVAEKIREFQSMGYELEEMGGGIGGSPGGIFWTNTYYFEKD